MNAVQQIRAATAADHEAVDAAFGRFAIDTREGYARFLTAHALALPAVEQALADVPGLPPRRPRSPLIREDLARLGEAMPDPLSFATSGPAASFGAAYVIEGSRLGGGLLSKQIPDDLPYAYLSATHLPGEWRGFLMALEGAAGGAQAWIDEAIASAKATFGLYREAAASA